MITAVILSEDLRLVQCLIGDILACLGRQSSAISKQLVDFNLLDMPAQLLESALMHGYPKMPVEFTQATDRLLLAVDPRGQTLLSSLRYAVQQPSFKGQIPTIIQPSNAIVKHCEKIGLKNVWLPAVPTTTTPIDQDLIAKLHKDGLFCQLSRADERQITELLVQTINATRYGGNTSSLLQALRWKLEQAAQRYNLQIVLLDSWAKPLLRQPPITNGLPVLLDVYSVYAEAACSWIVNTLKITPPRVRFEISSVLTLGK